MFSFQFKLVQTHSNNTWHLLVTSYHLRDPWCTLSFNISKTYTTGYNNTSVICLFPPKIGSLTQNVHIAYNCWLNKNHVTWEYDKFETSLQPWENLYHKHLQMTGPLPHTGHFLLHYEFDDMTLPCARSHHLVSDLMPTSGVYSHRSSSEWAQSCHQLSIKVFHLSGAQVFRKKKSRLTLNCPHFPYDSFVLNNDNHQVYLVSKWIRAMCNSRSTQRNIIYNLASSKWICLNRKLTKLNLN
jgi:hypothetical protein